MFLKFAPAIGIRLRSSMPRILFLGDIVGRPGRTAVVKHLADLRAQLGADLVVANGENSAAGAGIHSGIIRELLGAGVDGITLGDHVWDQRGFDKEIDSHERVCRPANLSPRCPGRRSLILTSKEGFRLGVFTVLGRQFMKVSGDDPMACADALVEAHKREVDAFLIEVHAETTAEKIAFGWYFDGRAGAILGTHTHVPTADGRILPRGTAYITDVGMSGPYESVLGRDIEPVVGRALDGMPRKFTVASGDVRICGALVDLEPRRGLATHFERIEFPVPADDLS